jgi:hypothetical protein
MKIKQMVLAGLRVLPGVLYVLLFHGCFQKGFKRFCCSLVRIDELHADMKFVLCEAFKVDQVRLAFNCLCFQIRQLQFEMYLDHNIHYRAGRSPVFGKDVMNRMTRAAEFQPVSRQVEYLSSREITVRESHDTMNIGLNPWMRSFNPEVLFHSIHACCVDLRAEWLGRNYSSNDAGNAARARRNNR